MAARLTANGTPLDEATYVIVDLETTGLDHRAEKIIEIGAVKMVGSRRVATFERLVNPNRLIPPKIVKLTGITNTMTADAPVIDEVLPGFAEFAGDAVLVAHNAHFDMSFQDQANLRSLASISRSSGAAAHAVTTSRRANTGNGSPRSPTRSTGAPRSSAMSWSSDVPPRRASSTLSARRF